MKKVLIVLLVLVIVAAIGVGLYFILRPSDDAASSSSAIAENSIDGTVYDAAMNTLSIETGNGARYVFSTEGALIEAGGDGLVIGDSVTVYYTGDLVEGQEAQTVTVTRVVVTSLPAQQDQSVVGVVTDATMNTLTIELANGATYTFSTGDAEMDTGADGLLVGDTVTVYYQGELAVDQQVQTVTVTRVEVTAQPVSSQETQATSTIEGTVIDASMNTMTIATAAGEEYTFSTMDAEIDPGTNGIVIGAPVTVTYAGTLVDGEEGEQPVTVVKVVVND